MSGKQREALKEIHCQISNRLNGNLSETKMLLDIKNIINKALAEPLRNCDVGTAEEQYRRFFECCKMRKMPCLRSYDYGCAKCYSRWSQMPYESSEQTKTNKGE